MEESKSFKGIEQQMASVGERLDALLKEAEMSVAALADAIGMSENNIHLLIREPGRGLHSENAAKIAQVFGVNERWLVTGYGPRTAADKMRADEAELLEDYNRLSPDLQKAVLLIAKNMLNTKG